MSFGTDVDISEQNDIGNIDNTNLPILRTTTLKSVEQIRTRASILTRVTRAFADRQEANEIGDSFFQIFQLKTKRIRYD